MPYQVQDINSELYDGSALTADGNSSEVDFHIAEGCPDAEIALDVGAIPSGGSITFIVESYNGSSYDNTAHQLVVTEEGEYTEYTIPIDNRVVTGSKLRLEHNVTLGSGESIEVHGHVRPKSQ